MRPKRAINTPPPPKSAEQALSSLMALCAKAEKSSGDARRLMSRWRVDPSEQERVLERLIDERFIDDQRYASLFTREKSRLNGWGIYKIRAELQRKGIAKEIIDEEIEGLDSDKMQERLVELLTKRRRTTKYTTPYQLRDKLIRYGASLGYNFSMVNDAVSELLKGEIDEEF